MSNRLEIRAFEIFFLKSQGTATHSGKFHDQGDAKWIVIREQLRDHNDTPARGLAALRVYLVNNCKSTADTAAPWPGH
jgi:hypothetical protein